MKDEKLEEIEFEKKRMGGMCKIPKKQYIKSQVRFNIREKAMSDIVEGIYEVLGRDIRDITIRYPENWWEAFKERFLPKWILQYFPVKLKTHRIKAMELYPKISFPEKGYIIVQKYNKNRG